MIGMPTRPMVQTIVLRFSSCCAFFGPSSKTSCQCAGSKFFNGFNLKLCSAASVFTAGGFSKDQSRSGSTAIPQPASSPTDWSPRQLLREDRKIHPMHDQMRCAALAGKAEVIRIELMPVKSKAKFHKRRIYFFWLTN